MENEKEDNKKSKKRCDHSEYKKFIPASWVKYIQDEIKKRLILGAILNVVIYLPLSFYRSWTMTHASFWLPPHGGGWDIRM